MPNEHSPWPVLALLRFALAAIVVSSHLTWFVPGGRSLPLTGLEPLGALSAVLGFLFVSGYSIAHSVDRRPGRFYRRRILRIYPLYVLAIGLSIVPFLGHGPVAHCLGRDFARPTWRNVAFNLLMLQNTAGLPLRSNDVIWTLAVEVIYYGLAPLFARASNRFLIGAVLASALAYGLHQWLGLGHFATERWGGPAACLAWAWVGGFLLHRRRGDVAVVAGLVALTAVAVNVHVRYASPYSVSTACLAVLVVALGGQVALPRWTTRAALVLGDVSYPLYLIHVPVLVLAQSRLHLTNPWCLVGLVLAASSVAVPLDTSLRGAIFNRAIRPASAGRRADALPGAGTATSGVTVPRGHS